MVNKILKNALQNNNSILNSLADDTSFHESFNKALDLCINSLKKNGTIYVAGNGGSASQADHFAGELVGRFYIDGNSLKVFSLNSNTAIITCIANDFSYDEIFSKQLSGQINENDIFIGLSTSGNSKNIVKAFDLCSKKGTKSILLTGNSENLYFSEDCLTLQVPSKETPRVQEVHIILLHCLAEEIEKALRNKI